MPENVTRWDHAPNPRRCPRFPFPQVRRLVSRSEELDCGPGWPRSPSSPYWPRPAWRCRSPRVGDALGRGHGGQRAAAARGGRGVPASVVAAARVDDGARPTRLYRLGAGPRPGGRLDLRCRHRDPDPAGVDGPVSPPVGIHLRRSRGRRRRGDHLTDTGRRTGRGDCPPGHFLDIPGRPHLRGHARAARPDPPFAGTQRATAGPLARADRAGRPGPHRRRPEGHGHPADLHGRAPAAERGVADPQRRGAEQDRGVHRGPRRDGPDAQGRHLRAGAAAQRPGPAAGDHGPVRATVPHAGDQLHRPGRRRGGRYQGAADRDADGGARPGPAERGRGADRHRRQ